VDIAQSAGVLRGDFAKVEAWLLSGTSRVAM
jgi:hypothetical protein